MLLVSLDRGSERVRSAYTSRRVVFYLHSILSSLFEGFFAPRVLPHSLLVIFGDLNANSQTRQEVSDGLGKIRSPERPEDFPPSLDIPRVKAFSQNGIVRGPTRVYEINPDPSTLGNLLEEPLCGSQSD